MNEEYMTKQQQVHQASSTNMHISINSQRLVFEKMLKTPQLFLHNTLTPSRRVF